MITTAPMLLEELRSLGVRLSTDGETLTINAPKGVIAPTLWEQLANQKQALITLLGSAKPEQDEMLVSDEDERLYTFASMVSHMVDVLGGPDQVRITKHEPGLTLEQYARQIRPPYKPVTLPSLPRSGCPFRVLTIKQKKDGDHLISVACQGIPREHGWCVEHAHSHELLCLGALLGYPPVTWQYRSIGEGIAQWEAYAERGSPAHMERDITSIRLRYNVQARQPEPDDLSQKRAES